MGITAIIFALDVLLTAVCIFIAIRLAWLKADFKVVLPVVFIVSLISLIPTYGWLLGIVIFIYLLMRATEADFKDCVWIVIYSKLLSALMLVLLSQAGLLQLNLSP